MSIPLLRSFGHGASEGLSSIGNRQSHCFLHPFMECSWSQLLRNPSAAPRIDTMPPGSKSILVRGLFDTNMSSHAWPVPRWLAAGSP